MSKDIDITAGDLSERVLTATCHLVSSVRYAQLIEEQPSIAMSELDLDPSLVEEILRADEACKRNAQFIRGSLLPPFLNFLSDSLNFNALSAPALERSLSAEGIDILATEAMGMAACAQSLEGKSAVEAKVLAQCMTECEKVLNAAITTLGEAEQQASGRIDDLKKQIQQNISDITTESLKLGFAIGKMIIQVLTKFESGGKNVKKPGETFDIVAKGITSVIEDVSNVSEAAAALQRNNEALIAEYQVLAASHAGVALAKVLEVQRGHFAHAVAAYQEATAGFSSYWSDKSKQLAAFAKTTDNAEAKNSAMVARASWAAVDKDLGQWRDNLRDLDSLPSA